LKPSRAGQRDSDGVQTDFRGEKKAKEGSVHSGIVFTSKPMGGKIISVHARRVQLLSVMGASPNRQADTESLAREREASNPGTGKKGGQ